MGRDRRGTGSVSHGLGVFPTTGSGTAASWIAVVVARVPRPVETRGPALTSSAVAGLAGEGLPFRSCVGLFATGPCAGAGVPGRSLEYAQQYAWEYACVRGSVVMFPLLGLCAMAGLIGAGC